MASPNPITPEVKHHLLQQAANWFAILQSDHVTEQEHQDWYQWINANPQNRQAWQQVEQISEKFNRLPNGPSQTVLKRTPLSRRQALKTLLVLCTVGGLTWQISRQQQWWAEYRTAQGEIREFKLHDGGQLWLNTASAADVNYDKQLRQIILHQGEILIQTAEDTASIKRPLVVDTPQGRLTALGTRFSVRQQNNQTMLAVFQGSVEIRPRHQLPQRIDADHQVTFNQDHIKQVSLLKQTQSAWIRGMILADNMPLHEFITELNRYHRVYLHYEPELANLRLVGTYPAQDLDRVLTALTHTFPIDVDRTLPWWINLRAKK